MLSTVYKESLITLVELYEKSKNVVRGKKIAKVLGKSPGTIRNQMQTLRALGYVEGIPGPKGGYKPSIKAYEVLNIEKKETVVEVPVYQDGLKIEGMNIQKISFTDVGNLKKCAARIIVSGDTRRIKDGAVLRIGPTPINKIIINGKVIGRNDTDKEILLETNSVISIPKMTAGDFLSHKLISVDPTISITECESLLVKNNIEAAPVEDAFGNLIGIVSLKDIAIAFASGKYNAKVGDIVNRTFYTVNEDTQLSECITMMKKYKTKKLIIVDSSKKPIGIITQTDIVNIMVD